MPVSMNDIKKLRALTQVSYQACKKALETTQGDVKAAADVLWSAGAAKAQAPLSQTVKEGVIAAATSSNHTLSALVEVNCQTDFVAKNKNFSHIAQILAQQALKLQTEDLDKVSQADCDLIQDAHNLEAKRQMLVVQLGENIQFRSITLLHSHPDGVVSTYCHRGRIAAVVAINVNNVDVAQKLAIHIVACAPRFITSDQIHEAERSHMYELCRSQLGEQALDEHINQKFKQSLKAACLLEQRLFQDSSLTIRHYLSEHQAQVTAFKRIEMGIEPVVSVLSHDNGSSL